MWLPVFFNGVVSVLSSLVTVNIIAGSGIFWQFLSIMELTKNLEIKDTLVLLGLISWKKKPAGFIGAARICNFLYFLNSFELSMSSHIPQPIFSGKNYSRSKEVKRHQ